MSVSKQTIEREAREAAHQGHSIADACPYPFGTSEAMHWLAVYALARPVRRAAPAHGGSTP